jgi:hypothetical protein
MDTKSFSTSSATTDHESQESLLDDGAVPGIGVRVADIDRIGRRISRHESESQATVIIDDSDSEGDSNDSEVHYDWQYNRSETKIPGAEAPESRTSSPTTTNAAKNVQQTSGPISSTTSLSPDIAERIRANRERAQRLQQEKENQRKEEELKQHEKAELESLLALEESLQQPPKPSNQPVYTPYTPEVITCTQLLSSGTVCGQAITHIERDTYYEPFGEAVCHTCKQKTEFDLLSKDQVRSEYLIPLDSIGHMKYSAQPNPRNPNWTPMRLYLRKHAIERAIKRFGTLEALDADITTRGPSTVDRDLTATDNFFEKAKLNLLSNGGSSASKQDPISSLFQDSEEAVSNPTSRVSSNLSDSMASSSGGFLIDEDENEEAPITTSKSPAAVALAALSSGLKRKSSSQGSSRSMKSQKSMFTAVAKSIKDKY